MSGVGCVFFASLFTEVDVDKAVLCFDVCVIARRNSEKIRSRFIFPRKKIEGVQKCVAKYYVLNSGEDGVRRLVNRRGKCALFSACKLLMSVQHVQARTPVKVYGLASFFSWTNA